MKEWHTVDNYYIGTGFFRKEGNAIDSWHWALDNTALLGMDFSSENNECVYQIRFELVPPPNKAKRDVEIYLNSILIEKLSAPTEYSMCFVGVPGKFYELEFRTAGNLTEVPGDSRRFAFMLKNFKLEKTEEDLEVSKDHRLIQKKYIEILDKYIGICDENNLSYYAFYGTLLGAVRHQGFIPWDDDIDVVMPREDFNRLSQIMAESKDNDYYFNATENVFYGGYAKFGDRRTTFISERDAHQKTNHGMAIDVLPLDRVEPEYRKRCRQLRKIQHLQELVTVKTYPSKKVLKDLFGNQGWVKMRCLALLYNRNRILKKLAQAFEESEESDFVTILARHFKGNDRKFYNKEDFSDTVELQFENLKIKVPVNYDACLRVDYGEAYLVYPNEKIIRKKHKGIINPQMPCKELEKHILYRPIEIRRLLIIGNLEVIEKYLVKAKNKKGIIYILDIENQSGGKMFHGCMVIGRKEAEKYYNEGYTILICTEAYERILEAMVEKRISNYYIYADEVV